jgi:Rod binding domain-containing protein
MPSMQAALPTAGAGEVYRGVQTAQRHAASLRRRGLAPTEDAQLRQACRDFSAVLLGQTFRLMGDGASWSEFGSGGSAERIWREMSYDEYAKRAAATDSTGLGELLYRSLSRQRSLGLGR